MGRGLCDQGWQDRALRGAAHGVQIEWAPFASGLSPAGDLGYTVGTSRFTSPGAGGARVESHRGSYVSIWRRQPGGGWKVLFDTGI